jgi:four helix bundle protein
MLQLTNRSMASIKSFEELEVWQLARGLSHEIYLLTQAGSFSKDYSLRDQINKSSGSTMDNIAEGFERGGNREFVQFLSISKGSNAEVRAQLYRAFDRKHIDDEIFARLKDKSILISKKLNGLIRYLNGSDLKGMKFHEPETDYIKLSNSEPRTQNPEL